MFFLHIFVKSSAMNLFKANKREKAGAAWLLFTHVVNLQLSYKQNY
jgi:hypothetical protein